MHFHQDFPHVKLQEVHRGDDDETPLGADEDPNMPGHPKPPGGPDSGGDAG